MWLGEKDGVFSVSSVKKLIVNQRIPTNNLVVKWSKWVPSKCNIHVWRAVLNSIPTRSALERRNIGLNSTVCPMCEVETKTVEHALIGCGVVAIVWDLLSRWLKIPPIFAFSVRDLMDLYKSLKVGSSKKEVIHGLIIITCWCLWKARNAKVFEGKEASPSEITGEIKNTDHQNVPFVTLMDILTHSEVVAKFRCVVRVVATVPGHPRDFKAPCGTYRLRLTLADPTARIHANLYTEDGVRFFGGNPPIDKMIKIHNMLLGVEETDKKPRNPPWVECCLNSYNINESNVWGSIKYRIFDTTLLV